MRTDHNVNEREKNVFIEDVQFCKKYIKNEKKWLIKFKICVII